MKPSSQEMFSETFRALKGLSGFRGHVRRPDVAFYWKKSLRTSFENILLLGASFFEPNFTNHDVARRRSWGHLRGSFPRSSRSQPFRLKLTAPSHLGLNVLEPLRLIRGRGKPRSGATAGPPCQTQSGWSSELSSGIQSTGRFYTNVWNPHEIRCLRRSQYPNPEEPTSSVAF